MLCSMMAKKKRTGAVPIYLNVYDLTPMNGYAYWLGLGVYHSGVQVHGVEYAFGAHDYATTGVFEVEPKQCPGFTFRKSILMGKTDLSAKDVRMLMEKLSKEYTGSSYHLISKNCNHFCNDLCIRLIGKSIPSWVNRLARLGLLCQCVLPVALEETKVHEVRNEDKIHSDSDKKKLRSQSRRNESFSSTSSTLTASSVSSINRSRKQRRCVPPSSSSSSSSSSYLIDTCTPQEAVA